MLEHDWIHIYRYSLYDFPSSLTEEGESKLVGIKPVEVEEKFEERFRRTILTLNLDYVSIQLYSQSLSIFPNLKSLEDI